MNYFIKELIASSVDEENKKHAGGKARKDIDTILSRNGWKAIEIGVDYSRTSVNPLRKLYKHIEIFKKWEKLTDTIQAGDSLLIQYPIYDHTILLGELCKHLARKKVNVIVLVHDLMIFREANEASFKSALRFSLEEKSVLKQASNIIVHNGKMLNALNDIIKRANLHSLSIFDYIIDRWDAEAALKRSISLDAPIIIAGNLRKGKADYVYSLPNNISFNLYGINYEGVDNETIKYWGAHSPEELPYRMNGSFGLVWDGESSETCAGIYGEYLRINNPHKVSLYLASEIPVVIWKQAALASFVKEHNCGIVVDSISEIENAINNLSEEQYELMVQNASQIGQRLREGYYTLKSLGECEKLKFSN